VIKNKEKIIGEKAEKITQIVRQYVEGIDTLSETEDFTIDSIESRWSALDEHTKEVYRELNDEIIDQVNEKEIIRTKKENMKERE